MRQLPLGSWLDALARDTRLAARRLRAAPGFSTIALLMLTLGIGANTAIFSLVSGVLLRPLPFHDPDALVLLWDDARASGGPARVESTPAEFVVWRSESRSFEGMAAFVPSQYVLTGSGTPDKLTGVRTTGNLFSLLRMQPLLGRTLLPDDERPDAEPVVVLNDRTWRTRFGGDPGVVGRRLVLNGLTHTVVGIVPDDFAFPAPDVALWVPARFTPEELGQRGAFYFDVLARLRPGVSRAQALAEMRGISHRFWEPYPQAGGLSVSITTLHDHLTGDARPAMLILLAAVGLVMLVACANLANLLLARGAARRREFAVRMAIGSGRGQLVRQLLIESLLLASAGAAAGSALAVAAFSYLAHLVPASLPAGARPTLDGTVLMMVAITTVVMVVMFGTGPAVFTTRVHLEAALKAGANRGTTPAAGSRLRSSLAVAEMTLTLVLLVAAGLLFRSYWNLLHVHPGFQAEGVLLVETVLPPSKYRALADRTGFYRRVLAAVERIPGVRSVGYANYPPLTFKGGRAYISVEGQPEPAQQDLSKYLVSDRVVSADYFRVLGVPLIAGRHLDARDTAGAAYTAIINQTMARRRFPGQDPLGHRIRFGRAGQWMTIVGVVGDVRQMRLDAPPEPEMYIPFEQVDAEMAFFWPQNLVIRTATAPASLAGAVRQAVWSVDPGQPVSNMRTMAEVLDGELLNRNIQLTLVGAFAALAFVMAAFGVYGVLSYNVQQRLPEIGIRIALGARRDRIVGGVVRGALVLAVVSVALGSGIAVLTSRLLRAWLFDVAPIDPSTFAAAAAVIVATAIAASAVPAFRGAAVDPAAVLRSE